MTKTIKQLGEAFNPHGVQFWANDENAVRKVLRFAEEVGAELDTHGTSHTIRLRIGGGETPAFTGTHFRDPAQPRGRIRRRGSGTAR